MKGREKQVSKTLSYILRHGPESIGITLGRAGWVEVSELLNQLSLHRKAVNREELDSVVANNSKQRFEFSDDGLLIRARQGHSVDIDLEYEAIPPPDVLFHGTADRFLESIMENGLQKRGRHHVHLSTDKATMMEVGRRHGKAVLLEIDSARMHADRYEFFVTGNNVWLTETIPPEYISQS